MFLPLRVRVCNALLTGVLNRRYALKNAPPFLRATANMIREAGIEVEIVSAGSTATYEITGTYEGITEIEPGSFVFGAGEEGSGYGWSAKNNVFFKNSLRVLTQVISDRHPDRVVTDAGVKALSAGHSYADPIVKVVAEGEYLKPDRVGLSEEHGTLYFKEGSL